MTREHPRTEQNRKLLREPYGLACSIYSNQKLKSKQRNHHHPKYSKIEFFNWMINQDNYSILMINWRLNGYKSELRPSADRIDNNKGYSFNNINLVTWEENNKNGRLSHRKKLTGVCIKTGDIIKFDSPKTASKELRIDYSSIKNNCNGYSSSSGGYKWSYDE